MTIEGDPERRVPDDKIADEEVTDEQVEATDEAAEAEGHAEQTDAGAARRPTTPPRRPRPSRSRRPTRPRRHPRTSCASACSSRSRTRSATPSSAPTSSTARTSGSGSPGGLAATRPWPPATASAARSFTFLSAIDWMPSPYGRSETSPFDPPPDAGDDHGAGLRRRRHPLPGASCGRRTPSGASASPSRPTSPTPTPASTRSSPSTPAPTGTSVRPGRCTASPSWATPTSCTSTCRAAFEGNPLRKDFPLLAREVKPWPGIVDVEPMPDEEAQPDEEASRRGSQPDEEPPKVRRCRHDPHRVPAAGLHRRPGRRRPGEPGDRDRGHDPQHRPPAPGHPRHAAHRRQARRRAGRQLRAGHGLHAPRLREAHRGPHVPAGHDADQPHRLAGQLRQRGAVHPRRRAAHGDRGAAPGPVDPHGALRARPDRQHHPVPRRHGRAARRA